MSEAPLNPTEEQFAEFARRSGADVCPLAFCFANDSLTASAVFRKVEADSEHAFFLESVETGEKIGRYSFIGLDPRELLRYSDGTMTVTDPGGNVTDEREGGDPLDLLQGYMGAHRCGTHPNLPPLWAGAVGYLGYDCVHRFEPSVGAMKRDEIGLPEMMWMIPDLLVAFDHMKSQIYVVKTCRSADLADPSACYREGKASVAGFIGRFLTHTEYSIDIDAVVEEQGMAVEIEEPAGTFSKEEYFGLIARAKEHIVEGDIFQVVPSQRFRMDADFRPYDVYRHLRQLNPSPYMFYLKFGGAVICGSSPETMVRCIDGSLTLKPIAGSRRRGKSAEEDDRLEEDLLADEKELAEHMMLVDLGRNDLGRVARPGSVRADPSDLMTVERYSHVMHIVSLLHARLDEGRTAYDAVRATFPAGTLSGAPKIRAMQVINGFEPARRNVYGGMCGYFGFDGNSDSCIALRMMVVNEGKAFVQAGGGVVADSRPEAEYQEIIIKASAVLKAIALARRDSARRRGDASR